MSTPFYITTAISYTNGAPHLGHAYEFMAADSIARFYRLMGRDVFFLTGTDEHGIKNQQTAIKLGITPLEMADRNSARFQEMAKALDGSNDDFIRTTEQRHYKASQALWKLMKRKGDIYKSTYSGWYSVRDEAYFDEADLLERDGKKFTASGAPVEWVDEESWFFKLSAYQEPLLKFYEENQSFITPRSRYNEIVSFVSRGLNDLSISRNTFSWGVPVPEETGHVMYVWVDALTNYLTACGFPDPKSERHKFWPANLHLVGKDIMRFHTVYWPAFLMSAGLPLPAQVFGHGFLSNKGEKMSKSLGNVVDPFHMAQHYGTDALRYFLLREIPFGNDGSYSHEAIVNRMNADLANDLGNLAQRSLSMIAKNCGGILPPRVQLSESDENLLALADAMGPRVEAVMKDYALHQALNIIWEVVAEANRNFATQEPWALKKTNPERMGAILSLTAEVLRQVAILAQPFIPNAAAKLLGLLNVDEAHRGYANLGGAGRLVAGVHLPAPEALFPRYVEADHAPEERPAS